MTENSCDWGQCESAPEAGAFCWFHADEYERVRAERDREWWDERSWEPEWEVAE